MVAAYFDHIQEFRTGKLRLVDLRSPGEFKLGAMPNAVNVPLFTDDERAAVGTTYKQVGQNDAVQMGLEFVANKMVAFLDELDHLAGSERRLAIHCWRGGMRSGSVAKLLQIVGIQPILLTGGYKTYRNQVLKRIDELANHKLLVLNGRTGCGKTQLIHELIVRGAPAIDFEGLASHRGSAIGHLNVTSPQPSQQNFENLLANSYEAVRNAPTVIVEIEQNIGRIQMPATLRDHIYSSDMILIERSLEDRVTHIASEYAPTWTTDDDRKFTEGMLLLKKHLQGTMHESIMTHVANRNFSEAIKLLILHRYDKCYDKAIIRQANNIKETISVPLDLTAAIERILTIVSFKPQTTLV